MQCVLSAIILVALTGMFKKFGELPRLWRLSRLDFCTWLVSFTATAFWDLTVGLGVSVLFALLTVVFRTQWPDARLLTSTDHSKLDSVLPTKVSPPQ